MPTPVKDQVWRLIKSLNKAEKRNFKLFATRAAATTNAKFIQLFDLLDRADRLDDESIIKRMKLTSGKYSNLKRHLYQQVLTSLRLLHINKEIDIELREQIDFARILYGKGHYLDALRILEKAKTKAVEHNQDLLHLEIVEFQKLIEARHVTLSRQVDNKMDLLLNESAERSYSILNTSELFNMNIQIHGRYIESGHSRSAADRGANEDFWEEIQTVRVDRETVTSTFHQKINRFQSAMWYHYIQLNFEESLEAAKNAATLFTLSRQMTVKDPDLYLRCLYYVGVFAYLLNDATLLGRYRLRLAHFLQDPNIQFNENSQTIGSIYLHLTQYNEHFLREDWDAAYAYSRLVADQHRSGDFRPAKHRWGLFLYKAAAAAFQLGKYTEALDHLNEIINMKLGIHREDLLINTRLLHALCNFELGHVSLVDYHLTSLARLLRRSRETAQQHRLAVSTIRKLLNTPERERDEVFADLKERLGELNTDPFEQKALHYLRLDKWTAAHLEPKVESGRGTTENTQRALAK